MEYFQVAVNVDKLDSDYLNFKLNYSIDNGELRLSPHVRLSNNKAAKLESKALAEEYALACKDIFKDRGHDVEFEVVLCRFHPTSSAKDQRYINSIKADTAIVKARLEQNMMAPNKAPKYSISDVGDINTQKTENIELLTNAENSTYQLYLNNVDIKKMMSISTFNRHKKALLEKLGINIAQHKAH